MPWFSGKRERRDGRWCGPVPQGHSTAIKAILAQIQSDGESPTDKPTQPNQTPFRH